MNKNKVIEKLQKLLDDFEDKYSKPLNTLGIETEKMKNACEKIKESWSGSYFGYHHKLYYGEFEKPPRDEWFSVEWGGINGISHYWRERTKEEVQKEINRLVGNSFEVTKFEKENKILASEIEDFQTQVDLLITSVTPKDANSPFTIEKIEPEKKLKAYLKSYMSRSMMSRDSEAVSQGIFVPSVIYYEAVAYEAGCIVSNVQKFLKSVKHFIHWYELQGTSVSDPNEKPLLTDLSLLHPDIFSKCQRLFETGEYAESVEKSFKVVRDKLRDLTGYETGSEAFGKGKLHIKGANAPNVDEDFNEGAKFLTMAIDRFRNEKSHNSNAKIDDPQQAYEYLTMSSLAMHLLDRAEIVSK